MNYRNNATVNEVIFDAESMEYLLNIDISGCNCKIPIEPEYAQSIISSFRNSTAYGIDVTMDKATKTIYYGVIVKQGQ